MGTGALIVTTGALRIVLVGSRDRVDCLYDVLHYL